MPTKHTATATATTTPSNASHKATPAQVAQAKANAKAAKQANAKAAKQANAPAVALATPTAPAVAAVPATATVATPLGTVAPNTGMQHPRWATAQQVAALAGTGNAAKLLPPPRVAAKRGSCAARYSAMLQVLAAGGTLAQAYAAGYTPADARWDLPRGQLALGPVAPPAQ